MRLEQVVTLEYLHLDTFLATSTRLPLCGVAAGAVFVLETEAVSGEGASSAHRCAGAVLAGMLTAVEPEGQVQERVSSQTGIPGQAC